MTDASLTTLTAQDARRDIARGALSSEAYVSACLDRIEALEPEIRAFTHLDRGYALAQARALDQRQGNGEPLGPLHGVPVAIKDIFDTHDFPTEYGSPLYAGHRPSRDATVVARLRAAGAVIIGKTVTTEFAYFQPGKTRNPHDTSRTPGGSSSGSAAAVAAGMVPLALGSQTNGSVIRPASFCGVFGAKPTHGLISRGGVLELSRILDHVGVFARTLDDVALLLDVMAGYDPADPDTRPIAAPNFSSTLVGTVPGSPKFAFVRTPFWDKAEATTRTAFESIARSLGDSVTDVALPADFADAWTAHLTIMSVDMAHRFSGPVARGSEDASSARLRDLLAQGRAVPGVDYLAACDTADHLRASLATIFDRYDAIITPSAIGVAPESLASTGDPVFCTAWTLIGVPALNLPVLHGPGGLPLGLQVLGPKGSDARLLRTAKVLLDHLSGKETANR